MMDFANQVGKSFHQQILDQADELIENMRDAVPKRTGTLASSLRKRDVSKGKSDSGRLVEISVLVIGGGSPTVRRTRAGASYDYSIATEFGTQKENPEPFFYTTFRKYRNYGLRIFDETLQEAIDENNELRAVRNDPGAADRLTTFRGAVVSRGK